MTSANGGAPSLNKGQVLSGLRCRKKLWIEFHEEHAPELAPSAEMLVRFEEGRVVGEHARRAMGHGVHLAPGRDITQSRVVERTREAIARGESLLFEAGFTAAGVSVRTDVLKRHGDAWSLIEVKQSKWPEKDSAREKKLALHLPDVAVQALAAREAAVPVATSHLMYLNPDCRHPDLSNLFTATEVTSRVLPLVDQLPPAIAGLHEMLKGAVAPDTPIGDQCTDPEECPFYGRCHGTLPEHHVNELYLTRRAQKDALIDAGKTMIAQLTEADAPNAPARRQVRAVKASKRVVEPGLGAALRALQSPVAYLDFETVPLAVPRWHRCRPQDMVAVQFSVHREGFADNTTRAFLAKRGGDPRPQLIAEMIEACAGAGSIVVYYEAFEKARIRELADCFPAHEAALMDIHGRIVDLLPIVRDHVYDPAFRGSFSLKTVLPALVPDCTYESLAIREGMAASAAIYRMLFDETLDAMEQDALRTDLLAYCHRDTEAMVRLVGVLRTLAA